ncbi:MAG: succinate dehydrogenase cytochrome b subunit [Planctomycetes bacterium]|nr:succinate dehydrogenase cytochrome b subunit [Planctomycetota bacterium]
MNVSLLAASTSPAERWVYAGMLAANLVLVSVLVGRLGSSLAKKYVMSLTGLALCGFLVIHLIGNAMMLFGAETYNAYADSLHKDEAALKVGEFALLFLFVAHIWLGLVTAGNNRAARGRRYDEEHVKRQDRTAGEFLAPDYWMLVSGLVIGAFLILHLWDFTIEGRPDIGYSDKTPFEKAKAILAVPWTKIAYVVGSVFLGWHLGHGVASSFQSLGIGNARRNRAIRWGGVAFAWLVALGFGIFPLISAYL